MIIADSFKTWLYTDIQSTYRDPTHVLCCYVMLMTK